jgi:hypothetical protein
VKCRVNYIVNWQSTVNLPRRCVQPQSSRSAGYDYDFTFKREDVGEVVEFCFVFRHVGGVKMELNM